MCVTALCFVGAKQLNGARRLFQTPSASLSIVPFGDKKRINPAAL
jgi:hypothetical protein